MKRPNMIKKAAAAAAMAVMMSVSAAGIVSAAETQIFFAPYTMNDQNEITVPVYMKNIPNDKDGVCGVHFSFAFDNTQFSIKLTDEGIPLIETNDAMVFDSTAAVKASLDGNIVTVDYLNYGAEESETFRDGPLFYYTLIPKNPVELYNSDNVYPLLFVAGSVQLRLMDAESGTMVSVAAEGVDVCVGGYNVFPTLESPSQETVVYYEFNSNVMSVNGENEEMDVPALLIDETAFVPIRFFAEAVGMDIKWDEENQTVSLYYPYKSTYVILDRKKIYINAVEYEELAQPFSLNDRTYLSIDAIKAVFGDMVTVLDDENGVMLSLSN